MGNSRVCLGERDFDRRYKFSAKKRQRLPESVLEGWGLHTQRFDLNFTPSTKLAKSKSHT